MPFWEKKQEKTKDLEELSNNLIILANKVGLLKADVTGLEMEVNKLKHSRIKKEVEKESILPISSESLNTLNPFKL